MTEKLKRSSLATAVVAGAMMVGAVGANAFNAVQAHAATSPPAPATASATTTPTTDPNSPIHANGKFRPNEDPAHEAKESPQREEQENAGQSPTVP